MSQPREKFTQRVGHLAAWTGRTAGKVVITLLLVLIAARLALPYVAKYYINKELAALPGYYGHVDDVDMSLWRGAYQIGGIRITKNRMVGAPLFTAKELEFRIAWRALFDGEIVADGDLETPRVNFVNGPTRASSQTGADVSWADTLKGLVPLRINRFSAHHGVVHYRDFHSEPRVNLFVQQIFFELRDIQNTDESSERLPSRFYLRALAMQSGRIEARAHADLLSDSPKFDLTFSLRRLRLVQLNPFLRAYAGLDAEAGIVSLYSELRSNGRTLSGYAKPLLEGVHLAGPGEDGTFWDRLGDFLAQGVIEILKNHSYDRFATRIPIQGRLDDPDFRLWPTIWNILRNGFIRAFEHGVRPD